MAGSQGSPHAGRLAAVGLAGGIVSGLLGVGGGIVFVPGLVLVASMAQRRAHATSLAAIAPIGLVGAIVYSLGDGAVDYALGAVIAAGAAIGAPLGVRALGRVPEPALRLIFAGIGLSAGIRLLVFG